MAIAMVKNTTSNSLQAINIYNFELQIPQVDGAMDTSISLLDEQLEATKYKCENCGKTFLTEQTLQIHSDEYEWGCDECSLCLTSKYLADLHELEFHPDSTAYIRDHIPDCTKKLFHLPS